MGGQGVQQVSPTDSAKAEALSQLAGSEFNLGSAPLQAYAEAINSLQFNPTFQRIANADSANSALANAQAAKQTQAQVNPYAAAGNDAMTRAANIRLANVMGQPLTPGLTPGNTTGAFQYPSAGQLPDFNNIMNQSKAITSAMPTVDFSNNKVNLGYPQGGGIGSPTVPFVPPSYFQSINQGA